MDKNEIILRISIIRQRANLSARGLSLAILKNASYINLLESKKNFEPSLTTLMDIIEVCGSSVEEFFYHDIHQYKKDREVLNFLGTLSPFQKDAILNLYKK